MAFNIRNTKRGTIRCSLYRICTVLVHSSGAALTGYVYARSPGESQQQNKITKKNGTIIYIHQRVFLIPGVEADLEHRRVVNVGKLNDPVGGINKQVVVGVRHGHRLGRELGYASGPQVAAEVVLQCAKCRKSDGPRQSSTSRACFRALVCRDLP